MNIKGVTLLSGFAYMIFPFFFCISSMEAHNLNCVYNHVLLVSADVKADSKFLVLKSLSLLS